MSNYGGDERLSPSPRTENRDLLVPPGSHAFVQIMTTGEVRVHVGPKAVTFSGTEQPVRFDDKTDSFEPCSREQSLRKNIKVQEGFYAILENPAMASDGNLVYPSSDNPTGKTLSMGRRVIIRGPVDFALWPRQKASVIQGHSLKSNQYLEAVIYDAENARKHWTSAVTATVAPSANLSNENSGGTSNPDLKAGDSQTPPAKTTEQSSSQIVLTAENLVMGQRLIITGESVSFYIPPTGIEVIAEGNGQFVREAVTLERLEYCILVDENGNKRYVHGPAVVFPRATERFFSPTNLTTITRKFKAIELPAKAGIHIKVIADYEENGSISKVFHKTGEELFITGEDQPIYYPSEFHSIIKYGDGQLVHFGVAIPKGEGRYVMNRITGEIRTVTGPDILLCDPREEVIVRRILTDSQCNNWYPGNMEALNHNRQLRQIQESAGSSRGDVVEDAYTRGSNVRNLTSKGAGGMSFAASSALESYGGAASTFEERAASAVLADEFSRSNKFTPPRSLTLNTKYEGVPTIDVWMGYAVMVVNKSGDRRIEQGPATVLLDYDETLEILTLSTSKPKTTDKLFNTVYLRTRNNKVSDIVDVETSDHVRCQLKLSFNVDFEGEGKNWFNSENYVKLLCDHVRSMLKGITKKYAIEEFYANATAIIRDSILGKREDKTDGTRSVRPGHVFEHNGMKVVDVEVLGNEIMDKSIGDLLSRSQREVVESNISLATAKRQLEAARQQETMERERLTAKATTEQHRTSLELSKVADSLKLAIERSSASLAEIQSNRKVIEANAANEEFSHNSRLERERSASEQRLDIDKAEQQLEMEKLEKETKATIERFAAVSGNFAESLAFLSRDENMVKISQALSFQTVIGGKSITDALGAIFGNDSPITKRLAQVASTVAGGSILSSVGSNGQR
jgi:major vault protein